MISLTLSDLFFIIPPLILLEGFFSGSEIALLSADKLTLKKNARDGDVKSALALKIANHPERVLSTTLLITSVCVICISALITLYCMEASFEHAELVATITISPIIVLLGELIPKTIYQRNATRWAPWLAYPVYWTFWIFFPVTRVLAFYTTRLSRLVGPIEELLSGTQKSTRDEIRSLLSYSRKESELKSSEKTMIKRIFDFRYAEAKHALIPLVRVEGISEAATVLEALECFDRHRHSRMPVYSERIDNIVGILEVTDLLPANELEQPIKHSISAAHYVAETQSLEDLMIEMREKHNEMVVIVDEYGGAVGILTLEDIIEEIVGEISDEYDFDAQPYKELSPNHWTLQARMEIQQINEVLKFDLPEGDYETLSGFLLKQFGRIPGLKDELFFDTPSGFFKFTIQKATQKHIEMVLIQKIKSTHET